MVSRIPKIELLFFWLSGCWLLFLIIFYMSSRNYIDPNKAVQELIGYTLNLPQVKMLKETKVLILK